MHQIMNLSYSLMQAFIFCSDFTSDVIVYRKKVVWTFGGQSDITTTARIYHQSLFFKTRARYD